MSKNLRFKDMEDYKKFLAERFKPKAEAAVKIMNNRRPRPRHEPGKMNKQEKAYSEYLEYRKHIKEITRWVFEPIKFRLADKTFYEIDFMVATPEQIEFHEFKGHWEDDARVKIKVVAELFPEFQFVGVTMKSGSYQYEYF